MNQKHRPFGYVSPFDSTPRPELAYVIGVSLGDGSTSNNKNHNHMIKLRVTDRDFASEFARCIGILLGRSQPPVTWHEKTQSWWTQVASLLLQKFLRQELNALAPTVSHCDDCKGAFIRGFFDSEGSISGRKLVAYNGDLDKLQFICELFSSLGIETTGPHLRYERGGMRLIKGKLWHVNKDSYQVYVRVGSLPCFMTKVGFSLSRKQERLRKAVGAPETIAEFEKGLESS